MKVVVEITGGCSCQGNYRCYCDSTDVSIKFVCTRKICTTKIGTGYRRYNKQTEVSIIGDQYTLERWFNEHLKEIEHLL